MNAQIEIELEWLTKKCKILTEIKVLITWSWQDINQEKTTAILSYFNVESL